MARAIARLEAIVPDVRPNIGPSTPPSPSGAPAMPKEIGVMRKFWFGLVLALPGLTPSAPAQEVIATTRGNGPVAVAPSSQGIPTVNLGRPRVASSDSGIVQASYQPDAGSVEPTLLPRPVRNDAPVTRAAAPEE